MCMYVCLHVCASCNVKSSTHGLGCAGKVTSCLYGALSPLAGGLSVTFVGRVPAGFSPQVVSKSWQMGFCDPRPGGVLAVCHHLSRLRCPCFSLLLSFWLIRVNVAAFCRSSSDVAAAAAILSRSATAFRGPRNTAAHGRGTAVLSPFQEQEQTH